jgi:hypothetical protein
MSRLVPITALILAGAFCIARADVYRWVDEHGEVHYSDQWMPGSVIIKTNKAHPPGYDAPTRTAEQRGLASSNARTSNSLEDEANARAMQQDLARVHDAQCKAAKERYIKAMQARRVYKTDKDGERSFLSDQEADTYRVQARKDVQDACGSVPAINPDAPIPEPQAIPEPKPLPGRTTR